MNNQIEDFLEIPLLPLRGVLVFPYMVVHLDVGREKSISAIDDAMLKGREIFLAMQKEAQTDEPGQEDIFQFGTVAEIKQLLKLPGGTIRVLVEGLYRARVESFITEDPYIKVLVRKEWDQVDPADPEVEALMRNLISQFEQYVKVSKKITPETVVSVVTLENAGRLADVVASHMNLKLSERQTILEAVSVKQRLESLCTILAKEMEILELERKISLRVRKQMEKTQKEYYLREQMKAIQKELGDKDDRSAEAEELREKIKKAKLPKEIHQRAMRELERLERMPPMVAEAMVVRNYIEWILDLPWSKETKDRLDLNLAEEILNEDHYGLKKVKERIIEYLAIRQLSKNMKGPILCFVGPPGVGKTSLAKSIARCLQRKFVRMSLGGVRDEAEIRGHRRTYVGAMPGRIIQNIKVAGSRNPVFLLDEIDKTSADFRGDPSSALLEVLDPEQNNTFADHYMEIPFDLSKAMFITTANVQYNIPRPLLDRMEIINITGYTEEEKLNIAIRHLLPKQLKEHGLHEGQLTVSENAIRGIIREYTREAGVRSLERTIGTICRKVAKEIVTGKTESTRVSAQNLLQYLGMAKYRYGLVEKEDQIGVATGMAWTEVGGEVLTIEAQALAGKGRLTLTGQLGDVMKESAQAAMSYVRSIADTLGVAEDFNENTDIHVHIPEGAIPKDGPSAGITLATAIISELSRRPVRRDVAMTGEITLRGRVLPVGGIKEKILAAHRAGSRIIVMPAENKKDLEEIPANVSRKMEFVFVENMSQVLPVVLAAPLPGKKAQPDLDLPAAALPAGEDHPVISVQEVSGHAEHQNI